MIEIDQQLSKLQIQVSEARREHISVIMMATASSTVVLASLPIAIFTDDPAWLNVTFALSGLFGSTFAIRRTEATQEKIKSAQIKLEDYQAQKDLSRLRP